MDIGQEYQDERDKVEAQFQGLNTRNVANWLHQSKSFRDSLTPEGVEVKTNSHDTAVHVHVYLTIEGEKPLLVWYQTNWVSSHYEFNERGKVSGIQPGCEFAWRPILEPFFVAIRDALKERELAAVERRYADRIEQTQERQSQVEKYRREFASA